MPKKKYKTKYEYKAPKRYDFEQRETETELQYYKRIAKAADQRLVRLEQLSKFDKKHFKGVKKFAYARAMEDISIYGKGKRFNTKSPDDPRLLKEKIMSIRHFLASPTSTKAGIIEVYQKKADTLNKNYGTNLKWNDLANYFGNGQADKNFAQYGYKTSLYALGLITQTDKVIKGIKNNTNITMTGPVTEQAIKMLKKRAVNVLNLSTFEKQKIIAELEKKQ